MTFLFFTCDVVHFLFPFKMFLIFEIPYLKLLLPCDSLDFSFPISFSGCFYSFDLKGFPTIVTFLIDFHFF